MKIVFFLLFTWMTAQLSAQELYVFSEPASNVPAHSLSIKLGDKFATSGSGLRHRLMPQLMYGFSKKLMMRAGASFANMHTTDFRYESYNLYLKYRFLSNDELHKHFRMAAFVYGSKTKAPFHFDEINLAGDKSGVEAGFILTQLWNKFAASATLATSQVLDESRSNKSLYPGRSFSAFTYSLSGGLLLLPREYTDYKQTNLNIYLEVLGQNLTDKKGYYVDLAPAIQLIFNSNAKLNLGYRFEAGGNMLRMNQTSWMISFERTLLNAFKK